MKLAVAMHLCVAVLLSSALFGQQSATSQTAPPPAAEKKDAGPPPKHKIGPLEISVNWRTRAEGWNWFEAPKGNSD